MLASMSFNMVPYPRPKRWSYSALSTYKDCPFKYKCNYILKLRRPPSKAADRGTTLHGLAEKFMLEPSMPVPGDLAKIGKTLDDLRSKAATPEDVWLLDRSWGSTDNEDSAWIKAVVDVHYIVGDTLYLYDYKSGKQYPGHRDQLELYSIIGLSKFPQIDRVESGAVYIDGGVTANESSIIRAMLPFYRKKWNADAERMEADTEFAPKPGAACRFCPYKDDQGGPCHAYRNT